MNTLRRVFGELKEATHKYGYEAPPEQIGWSLPIYVADTDEQAVAEARRTSSTSSTSACACRSSSSSPPAT